MVMVRPPWGCRVMTTQYPCYFTSIPRHCGRSARVVRLFQEPYDLFLFLFYFFFIYLFFFAKMTSKIVLFLINLRAGIVNITGYGLTIKSKSELFAKQIRTNYGAPESIYS